MDEQHKEKIQRLKEQHKIKCIHIIQDGAGWYCGLMPVAKNIDYPHKYWRIECFGNYMQCKYKNLYKEK